jgi:hypothetical protein
LQHLPTGCRAIECAIGWMFPYEGHPYGNNSCKKRMIKIVWSKHIIEFWCILLVRLFLIPHFLGK